MSAKKKVIALSGVTALGAMTIASPAMATKGETSGECLVNSQTQTDSLLASANAALASAEAELQDADLSLKVLLNESVTAKQEAAVAEEAYQKAVQELESSVAEVNAASKISEKAEQAESEAETASLEAENSLSLLRLENSALAIAAKQTSATSAAAEKALLEGEAALQSALRKQSEALKVLSALEKETSVQSLRTAEAEFAKKSAVSEKISAEAASAEAESVASKVAVEAASSKRDAALSEKTLSAYMTAEKNYTDAASAEAEVLASKEMFSIKNAEANIEKSSVVLDTALVLLGEAQVNTNASTLAKRSAEKSLTAATTKQIAAFLKASVELSDAQTARAGLTKGATKEEIEAADARVAKAEASLADAEKAAGVEAIEKYQQAVKADAAAKSNLEGAVKVEEAAKISVAKAEVSRDEAIVSQELALAAFEKSGKKAQLETALSLKESSEKTLAFLEAGDALPVAQKVLREAEISLDASKVTALKAEQNLASAKKSLSVATKELESALLSKEAAAAAVAKEGLLDKLTTAQADQEQGSLAVSLAEKNKAEVTKSLAELKTLEKSNAVALADMQKALLKAEALDKSFSESLVVAKKSSVEAKNVVVAAEKSRLVKASASNQQQKILTAKNALAATLTKKVAEAEKRVGDAERAVDTAQAKVISLGGTLTSAVALKRSAALIELAPVTAAAETESTVYLEVGGVGEFLVEMTEGSITYEVEESHGELAFSKTDEGCLLTFTPCEGFASSMRVKLTDEGGSVQYVTFNVSADKSQKRTASVGGTFDALDQIESAEDSEFRIVSGELPAGITMNENGEFIGNAAVSGSFQVLVEVYSPSLGITETRAVTLEITADNPSTIGDIPEELAFTGATVNGLGLAGLILVTAGFVVVVPNRRRVNA